MRQNKILIIEDEQSLSQALVRALTKEGFLVSVSENGQQGLKVVKKENPNIILLDVMMPVMNGLEMLKELRKIDKYSKLPVVIISNYYENEQIAESLSQGAYDYLVKSDVKIEEIVEIIKSKLKSK